MTLLVLPEAEKEADEAAAWYLARDREIGRSFIAELRRALNEIKAAPDGSSRLETYDGPRDFRRYRLHRSQYHIVEDLVQINFPDCRLSLRESTSFRGAKGDFISDQSLTSAVGTASSLLWPWPMTDASQITGTTAWAEQRASALGAGRRPRTTCWRGHAHTVPSAILIAMVWIVA